MELVSYGYFNFCHILWNFILLIYDVCMVVIL